MQHKQKPLTESQIARREQDANSRAASLARLQEQLQADRYAEQLAHDENQSLKSRMHKLGAALSERGPADGLSMWRERAEAFVELWSIVEPLRTQCLTWQMLRQAVPAHLLRLAQELHASCAARANARLPGQSEVRPIDIGQTEVFAMPWLFDALDPLARKAFAELTAPPVSIETLEQDYARAVSAARDDVPPSAVYVARSAPAVKAALEQRRRDLDGARYLATARLIAHPAFEQAFNNSLPVVSQ